MSTPTAMPTSAPSRKVVAATGGAGAGAVTAGLVEWLLGRYVFHGDVPTPVDAFVFFVIPTALAYLGGYVTSRGPEEVEQSVADRVAQIKADSAALRELRSKVESVLVQVKAAPDVDTGELVRQVVQQVNSNLTSAPVPKRAAAKKAPVKKAAAKKVTGA